MPTHEPVTYHPSWPRWARLAALAGQLRAIGFPVLADRLRTQAHTLRQAEVA